MATDIKNQVTLYRFTSLRSPELSQKKDITIRFVYYPDGEESPYFESVRTKPDTKSNWAAMQDVAIDSFALLPTEAEVRAYVNANVPEPISRANDEFMNVAIWVARNRSNLDVDALYNMAVNINPLEDDDSTPPKSKVLNLWSNLFYQIVNQKDFYAKEALMQVLVLQNLLEHIEGKSKAEAILMLNELANAKVVIPKLLFGYETPQISTERPGDNKLLVSLEMKNAKRKVVARQTINDFSEIVESLRAAERSNKIDSSDLFQEKLKAHKELIKPILDNYRNLYDAERTRLCTLPRDVNYDPNDFCNLPHIPYPDLPKFEFDRGTEFDLKKMQSRMTEDRYKLLTEVIGERGFSTFSEVINHVNKLLSKESSQLGQLKSEAKKTIVIGESVITTTGNFNRGDGKKYDLCAKLDKGGRVTFLLTVGSFQSNLTIEQLTYSVTDADGHSDLGIEYGTPQWVNGGMSVGGMYVNNDSFIGTDSNPLSITVSVYLEFNNGEEYSFTTGVFSLVADGKDMRVCKFGEMHEEGGIPTEEEAPKVDDTFIPKGFGYRQLGIADYRKVVAEVCCYEAGEVAHIENIMASELRSKVTTKTYKSEVTDFESTEIEQENMTDTVSTQRFEMQSEVSKLLAEDRQFGASGQVHSKWGNTTLDAASSYATNTNKEESNRQAVTQAKELTQRAVERIVTRTKKEKTVKITNEFVEENTHAFDNRGNGEHISGVFRFINSIYKNQIFNYGKRLMYEFMVPQPSVFHNMAMSTVIDTDDKIEFVLPESPESAGLTNFNSIDKTNYQGHAATYNADIEPYPVHEKIYGKALSMSGGLDTPMSISDVVAIKDNRYESALASIVFNGATPGGYPFVAASTVTVGTVVKIPFFSVDETIEDDIFLNLEIPKYEDEVPIAAFPQLYAGRNGQGCGYCSARI